MIGGCIIIVYYAKFDSRHRQKRHHFQYSSKENVKRLLLQASYHLLKVKYKQKVSIVLSCYKLELDRKMTKVLFAEGLLERQTIC